jgi:hypothetical protein
MADFPSIHALVMRHEDWWVAQCLQYNIAAQAKTLDDLAYELQRTIVARIALAEELGVEPFENLPPAPPEYWERFRGAMLLSADEVPFRVPMGRRAPMPSLRIAA